MSIHIRYFASVRELLGASDQIDIVDLPGGTMGDLLARLITRSAKHAEALGSQKGLRMACNLTLCEPSLPLKDGDEVAFFPPVTGG